MGGPSISLNFCEPETSGTLVSVSACPPITTVMLGLTDHVKAPAHSEGLGSVPVATERARTWTWKSFCQAVGQVVVGMILVLVVPLERMLGLENGVPIKASTT